MEMEQGRAHERRSQVVAGIGRDAAIWVAGAVPIALIIALWHLSLIHI